MNRFFVTLLSLVVCATGVCAQASTAGASPAKKTQQIRVQDGETLATIAEQYQVTLEELAWQNHLRPTSKIRKGQRLTVPVSPSSGAAEQANGAEIIGKRIKFADGRSLEVDEAWRQGTAIWFRRGGVTQSLDAEVKSIESIVAPKKVNNEATAAVVKTPAQIETWIYLVGGARFKVDDLSESAAGAWYNRGNLSVFVDRERIARIVREDPANLKPGRSLDWSSGNPRIDELIKVNGTRYGVDPYLVFCVIEQESHFQSRALSPKGARGLMQLMPGTASRFGVRNSFDVAENIKGGTQYLRELMNMFGGQVNLVLASYNAGEGAVMKYGRTVPPYRETREYVKKIGKRYGLGARERTEGEETVIPRR